LRYTLTQVRRDGRPVDKEWDAYYRCRPQPGERRKSDQKRERIVGLSKAEAVAYLENKLAKIALGKYLPPTNVKVADYLRQSIEDRLTLGKIGQSQFERYQLALRQILFKLDGNLRLEEVQPLDISRCISGLIKSGGGRFDKKTGKPQGTPLQRTTVREHHFFGILSAAFSKAVSDGLIDRSPCTKDHAPTPEHYERHHLNLVELVAFLDRIESEAPVVYIAALLGGLAGLRRGEVLALRDIDVDLQQGVVTVRHSVEESAHGCSIKVPKSGKVRRVQIPPSAVAKLAAHRLEQGLLRERIGDAWNAEGWVVPGLTTGRMQFPSKFSQYYTAAVRRLGRPEVTFHCLRHSYVTALVTLGVDVKTTADQAGHASAVTTLGTYTHGQRGAREAAATIFETALKGHGFGSDQLGA
jgi:integrase